MPVSAQPIRVGSVASDRFPSNWTLDGSNMQDARAKLLNLANFGVGGTYLRPVTITDTALAKGSVNASLLAQFDVFFIGFLVHRMRCRHNGMDDRCQRLPVRQHAAFAPDCIARISLLAALAHQKKRTGGTR